MRLKLSIILVIMAIFITACSTDGSDDKSENTTNDSELKDTSSKFSQKEEEGSKKEDEVKVEAEEQPTIDESWFGNWVFLSDDVNGIMRVQQKEDNQAFVYISGSRMNPANNGSYGNTIEAKGIFEKGKITFTSETDAACSGNLEKSDNVITLTTDNEICNTPQIYLDGDYQKEDSIEPGTLFSVADGSFQIYGVAIEDSPSSVKSYLGNPSFEGPSEDGFYPWMLEYDEPSAIFSFFDNQINSIIVNNVKLEDYAATIPADFSGKYYTTEDGATLYLYNPANEQLLIYRFEGDDFSTGSLLLTYADGNFHYGVESGWIVEVDGSWE